MPFWFLLETGVYGRLTFLPSISADIDKHDATVIPSVWSSDGSWNVTKFVSFDNILLLKTGNSRNSFLDNDVKFSTSSACTILLVAALCLSIPLFATYDNPAAALTRAEMERNFVVALEAEAPLLSVDKHCCNLIAFVVRSKLRVKNIFFWCVGR